MLELELTYLAKYLPANLAQCKHKEIVDIYFPKFVAHPILRLRKNGEAYELTKKQPVVQGDASIQREDTILLDQVEFDSLNEVEGKRIQKLRYYYNYEWMTAEIDVFQWALKGLVVVDFEFNSPEQKDVFQMPDFCLADITQEVFIAGGMICGKSYQEIEKHLAKHNYKTLKLPTTKKT